MTADTPGQPPDEQSFVSDEERQAEQERCAKTGIDTSRPHSARIWNYWLGGKDHYEIDRVVGEEINRVFDMSATARATLHFRGRVVRYLAGEAGVRQFLDVGTGLPTADNTHEVAQRVNPDARVVYVDNDPLVITHARALLTGEQDTVRYVDADLRTPGQILEEAGGLLDFTEPIALLLMGILGHMGAEEHTDRHDAYQTARQRVTTLVDALPAGSYLGIYDCTDTHPGIVEAERRYMAADAVPYLLRSPQQLEGFFDGLELVEPGVVSCPHWRPEVAALNGTAHPEVPAYGGLARKGAAQ